MPKFPDRFYVDKKDKEIYDRLEIFKEKEGEQDKKTRREQFMFAMAMGFINKVRQPIKNKENFFLAKDLRYDDEALINSVALFNNDVEILLKKEEVFKIAEEYAHAGLKILDDKIQSISFGNFWKIFEKDIHELHDKYFLENK